MIVDTSAIIAILKGEPERSDFVQSILDSPASRMSAANYLEAALVVDNLADPVMSRRLDELLEAIGIQIADITAEHARVARAAYRDFGRGSGHAARLNFGDCFAYALAAQADDPLLFKGDDFRHTDLKPVTS